MNRSKAWREGYLIEWVKPRKMILLDREFHVFNGDNYAVNRGRKVLFKVKPRRQWTYRPLSLAWENVDAF